MRAGGAAGRAAHAAPLPNVAEWCRCFDLLQMNEDEMAMMAPDPMAWPRRRWRTGVSCLIVTLGKRGVVYFAAPGFEQDLSDSCGSSTRRAAARQRWARCARRWFRREPTCQTGQAIRPDAATSGAQPISPGCSPVIS